HPQAIRLGKAAEEDMRTPKISANSIPARKIWRRFPIRVSQLLAGAIAHHGNRDNNQPHLGNERTGFGIEQHHAAKRGGSHELRNSPAYERSHLLFADDDHRRSHCNERRITGATGRTMPECMAAWDKATHITKSRWREICVRTLTEPHI